MTSDPEDEYNQILADLDTDPEPRDSRREKSIWSPEARAETEREEARRTARYR